MSSYAIFFSSLEVVPSVSFRKLVFDDYSCLWNSQSAQCEALWKQNSIYNKNPENSFTAQSTLWLAQLIVGCVPYGN